MRVYLYSLFLLLSGAAAAQGNGYVFAIGGGERPEYMMERYVELGGGKNAPIVIIPMASEDPVDNAAEHVEQFKQMGCTDIRVLIFELGKADADSNLRMLSGCRSVFFPGGDQARLAQYLLGTRLFTKIQDIFNAGGIVGGTSAGAAIMSKVMLTGNELKNSDSTIAYKAIQQGNVETITGFGFISKAIIDQHFLIRKRHNRAISVALEQPKTPVLAIDEATAILVKPDASVEVIGESQVVVYDAVTAKRIRTGKQGRLGAKGIKMHLLLNGDRYNLTTHRPL